MENQTSFDLNAAIQRWRENLAQSAAFQTENLNELESHLRDSVAKLQTRELSAEEAFLVASRRLGGGGQLAAEFSKMNRNSIWLDRLLWMLIGIQTWGIVVNLVPDLSRWLLIIAWRKLGYNWREGGLTLPVGFFASVQLISIVASVWLCWWLIFKKSGKLGPWFTRKLQSRSSALACGIGLCLLSIILHHASSFLRLFLGYHYGPSVISDSARFISYSQAITPPIQLVVTVAITIAVARRRLLAQHLKPDVR